MPIVNPGTFIHTALVLRNKFVVEHTPNWLGESSFIIHDFAGVRKVNPFFTEHSKRRISFQFQRALQRMTIFVDNISRFVSRGQDNFFGFRVIMASRIVIFQSQGMNLPFGGLSLGLR